MYDTFVNIVIYLFVTNVSRMFDIVKVLLIFFPVGRCDFYSYNMSINEFYCSIRSVFLFYNLFEGAVYFFETFKSNFKNGIFKF